MKATALRTLLTVVGLLSIAHGVLGIFLPVLPTVPLILLAAACFARSSDRFHDWLLRHRFFGPMIDDYRGGKGVPLRAKVIAITTIWGSILISAGFLIPLIWVKIVVVGIGLCVTIYLLRLPLRDD